MALPRDLDVFCLEGEVWLAIRRIDNPAYDFAFSDFFACRRPYDRPERTDVIARVGAVDDYPSPPAI